MMVETLISKENWEAWRAEGLWSLLPCAIGMKSPAGLPKAWRAAWEQGSAYSFVLESGKGGRYTFLGLNPVSVIRGKGSQAEVTDLTTGAGRKLIGKPLELIKGWLAPCKSPSHPALPKLGGGAVGFLGYDIARSLERLPALAQDDLGLDDYVWMRFEELWIWDEAESTIYAVVHKDISVTESLEARDNKIRASDEVAALYDMARTRAAEMLEAWQLFQQAEAPLPAIQEEQAPSLDELFAESKPSMSQSAFEDAVRQVQEYIAAGDVFQVNLSLRHAFPLAAKPETVYEGLRLINPSPYMGLIRFPEFQLVSASPELLVKLETGRLSTRPIAGTRRRGLTADEDIAMETELLRSEKERAEHIMLVDLLRNDIGRVAAYGSVHVSELLTVERYSHVMHLVSEVEGTLAEPLTAFEAIAAIFPGGTITGAPKVRTMEIIEELEPVTRGPYTGAMGWIDYQGNMELNIIIRTLVAQDEVGYIQAGAGIVIDSDPYREYRESQNKAKAIAIAIRHSTRYAPEAENRRWST